MLVVCNLLRSYSKRVDATQELATAVEVCVYFFRLVTFRQQRNVLHGCFFVIASLQSGNKEDIEKFSKRTVKVSSLLLILHISEPSGSIIKICQLDLLHEK